MTDCSLCGGRCTGADLGDLVAPDLAWLWAQVAACADRRKDEFLTTGELKVVVAARPEERAAAVGLLGGGALRPGQKRTVQFAALTEKVRRRGSDLTPGVVAAHAMNRPLAVNAKAEQAISRAERSLYSTFADEFEQPFRARALAAADVWESLRQAGVVTRLVSSGESAMILVPQAAAVVTHLPPPGQRTDRRLLAETTLDNPHALDDDEPVGGLVLSVMAAMGVTGSGAGRRRAWDMVGVDYDDLLGGLLSAGVHPHGWMIPDGEVVTLPPRILEHCRWPAPPRPGAWLFVTENPSIIGAAATGASAAFPVRVLCTAGNPSALGAVSIARLAEAGWSVAVRADFDPSGLAFVTALTAAGPAAVPWRMDAGSYLECVRRSPNAPKLEVAAVGASAWDPKLAETMRLTGSVGFEESIISELLSDIRAGRPSERPPGGAFCEGASAAGRPGAPD
jgi:uncharacterized protein (TIGR02679 family)